MKTPSQAPFRVGEVVGDHLKLLEPRVQHADNIKEDGVADFIVTPAGLSALNSLLRRF